MPFTTAAVRKAVAKVNLSLKVTARRSDGFHELRTLFWPLPEVCDTVTLTESPSGALEVGSDDPLLPAGADNLVGRAALEYARRAGLEPAWRFFIEKRIPVTAGLGGGSSDAAAALRLLQDRYGALGESELAALALELGSDVPYFLSPVPARATGRGERLAPLDFAVPELEILLVNPRFPVRACWAYTHLEPSRIGPDDGGRGMRLEDALRRGDAEEVAANLGNDLAFALYEKFPLLQILRDALLEAGATGAEISGSGPTVFAICRDKPALAAAIRARFPAFIVL